MKKVFESILTIIFIIVIFVMGIAGAFVGTFGLLEIAWWIITGEFFHFVDLSGTISTF